MSSVHAVTQKVCSTCRHYALGVGACLIVRMTILHALQAALNIRNSPVELSFMGNEDGMLWCRTAAETLHLWNWSQSVSEQAVDYMAVEEDPEAQLDSCDMMDVREQLNNALKLDPGSFKGQVRGITRQLPVCVGLVKGHVCVPGPLAVHSPDHRCIAFIGPQTPLSQHLSPVKVP